MSTYISNLETVQNLLVIKYLEARFWEIFAWKKNEIKFQPGGWGEICYITDITCNFITIMSPMMLREV